MPKGKDVIGLAKDKQAVMVDMKFMDFLGLWQHFTIPIAELSEGVFEEGLGFDGSSIRGWMPIHASDMLVVPDPDTALMDPFMKDPTLSLICNVVDPITKENYARDPRFIAQKAERYLKQSGVGDVAYYGPEAEFFIFDGVSYDSGPNHAHYKIESREGQWETGSAVEHIWDGKTHTTRPNLGYKPRYKEGYFPVAPLDSLQDIRTEMCRVMEQCGILVERQHHEVATAGQAEIDIRFDSLVKTADKLMWFKYIIKNVALRNGKTVTFMPKPLFAGEGYAGISEMALHYIGGVLKHARALAALCNPTTNSYKRLVPG
ncbi:MAG TPA: glutamine synthetase beta-grasp domain-containing protein, partial [Myxococcales bacterium]